MTRLGCKGLPEIRLPLCSAALLEDTYVQIDASADGAWIKAANCGKTR